MDQWTGKLMTIHNALHPRDDKQADYIFLWKKKEDDSPLHLEGRSAAQTNWVRVSARSRPSPSLYSHFNRPSGFWPCVKSCLVGGSDNYKTFMAWSFLIWYIFSVQLEHSRCIIASCNSFLLLLSIQLFFYVLFRLIFYSEIIFFHCILLLVCQHAFCTYLLVEFSVVILKCPVFVRYFQSPSSFINILLIYLVELHCIICLLLCFACLNIWDEAW